MFWLFKQKPKEQEKTVLLEKKLEETENTVASAILAKQHAQNSLSRSLEELLTQLHSEEGTKEHVSV